MIQYMCICLPFQLFQDHHSNPNNHPERDRIRDEKKIHILQEISSFQADNDKHVHRLMITKVPELENMCPSQQECSLHQHGYPDSHPP